MSPFVKEQIKKLSVKERRAFLKQIKGHKFMFDFSPMPIAYKDQSAIGYFLKSAFIWDQSKKGVDYWLKVYSKFN